jgi:hypothetical protein
VRVDPEDPVAARLIDRGELVVTAAAQFEVLDVDLDGLAGHGEFRTPAGPWGYRFIETRGTPCRLRIS